VIDVEAVVEDGPTFFGKVAFTVYAIPNQFVQAERRRIGGFHLDISLSDNRAAVQEGIKKTIDLYIHLYTPTNKGSKP
jgi:hypothetical protein